MMTKRAEEKGSCFPNEHRRMKTLKRRMKKKKKQEKKQRRDQMRLASPRIALKSSSICPRAILCMAQDQIK
jgi:hypothetical protein